MAKDNKKSLTQSLIERAICEGDSYTFIWDTKQEGLGVQVRPSGHKAYVFLYVIDKKSKRKTIASCSKINLEQARKLANGYSYLLTQGKDPFEESEPERIFYELCVEYIEVRNEGNTREGGISKNTYRGWKNQIKNHVEDKEIGNLPLSQIKPIKANKFMDSLKDKPATANRIRSLLKLVTDYCMKKELIIAERNCWDLVDKFEEAPKRTRLIESEHADKDEPTAFFNYMEDAERGIRKDGLGRLIDKSWIYLIWLCYWTGARPSEIQTITFTEIDFNESVIVKGSKTGVKTIYLSQQAVHYLKKAILTIPRQPGNVYIFAGKGGESYRKSWNDKQWKNLISATGIKNATPYALRRYFMTLGKRTLVMNNTDKRTLSDIVGHATQDMTEMYAGDDKYIIELERKALLEANEIIAQKLKKS